MAVALAKYPEKVELFMQRFYNSLNEKDQRHYVALEAHRLGHGGVNYIASVLGCSRQTIYSGLAELEKKQLSTQ